MIQVHEHHTNYFTLKGDCLKDGSVTLLPNGWKLTLDVKGSSFIVREGLVQADVILVIKDELRNYGLSPEVKEGEINFYMGVVWERFKDQVGPNYEIHRLLSELRSAADNFGSELYSEAAHEAFMVVVQHWEDAAAHFGEPLTEKAFATHFLSDLNEVAAALETLTGIAKDTLQVK